MDWRYELLSLLADPNIAYILLMIGIYGIFFELYNPGAILPGIIGGISILLGAYSLQMLPINYAGLALILLGIILFLIEIKVPSYGLLTIGGVISLFLGSLMLIDSAFEFLRISLAVIITVVLISVIFFSFVIGFGIKAQFRKKQGGKEGLVGLTGIAMSDIIPGRVGSVKVCGEIWRASSDLPVESGSEVIIDEVEGLKLKVRKK